MRRSPPCPVAEEIARHWRCVFNNTATYGNYVSLLGDFFAFLRFPTAWPTAFVRHAARFPKKCHDRSARLPNFIRIRLLSRHIGRVSTGSGFAMADSISFLSPSRPPAETLRLTLVYSAGAMGAFPHQMGNPSLAPASLRVSRLRSRSAPGRRIKHPAARIDSLVFSDCHLVG